MPKRRTQHLDSPDRRYTAAHWAALAFIVVTALWIRIDDLIAWHQQPQKAFHNGQPILINFDGYFYLSLARDLLNDEYEPLDNLRGVPKPQKRPMPPPLISILTAGIAAITPFSLDWIASILPIVLGVLLAVPLYLFSRLFGGPLMAIVALIVGLCARYYVYRSNFGWFDTDCLNVTFAFLITYLFLRFGIESTTRRYAYLASGFVASALFLLWWDQTRTAVILIALCPLVMVLVLYYRPQGAERWLAIGIGAAAAIGLLAWYGPQLFMIPYEKTLTALGYINKTQVGEFPNTALSVMEQKRVGIHALARVSTGNLATFVIGLAGLVWLFVSQKRPAIPLMALFGLGCFSFVFARRFLVFLNPFLAIGLGYAAQRCWDLRSKWPVLKFATPLGAALVCLFAAKDSLHNVYWPKEIPPIVEGMQNLSETSSKHALVWAWWDHGYPLRYWSKRATINDGSLHNGPRTVSNAIPLVSLSPRQAANFMYFYAARGVQGIQTVIESQSRPAAAMQLIKTIFEAGPEKIESHLVASGLKPLSKWRDFFFPPRNREINLFLDYRVARTAYWWHWFGTWDMNTKTGVHGSFKLLLNLRQKNKRLVGPNLSVDLEKGVVVLKQKKYQLRQFIQHDGQRARYMEYNRSTGLVFVHRLDLNIGALMDVNFAQTLFNQLYMLENPDSRYFARKSQRFPYYQIWQVKPDPIPWQH